MKPFTLPTAIVEPIAREPLNLCLYGLPGIGKTPIAATLPNHGYLDCQAGSYHIACRRGDVCGVAHELDEPPYVIFESMCEQFKKANVSFLVVDTIGDLADWAEEKATDYYRTLTVSKNWEGSSVMELPGVKGSAGFGYLWQAFNGLLNASAGLRHRTIYIGHCRDRMMTAKGDGAKGEAIVEPDDLDLQGKMRRIFTQRLDAVGYVYKDWAGNGVKISFFGKDAFAKCRCQHLYNKTITLSNPVQLSELAYIYCDTLREHLTPAQHTELAKVYKGWIAPTPPAATPVTATAATK